VKQQELPIKQSARVEQGQKNKKKGAQKDGAKKINHCAQCGAVYSRHRGASGHLEPQLPLQQGLPRADVGRAERSAQAAE